MIEAGEDPRFIARRLMISASEDTGMADPTALQTAVAAAQAVALIGFPEARIALGQTVVALALAPKSNAAYLAIDAALADVRAGLAGPVPPHLRDSHYKGSATLGHGKGYQYPHDLPGGIAAQQYAPDAVHGRRYYAPTRYGAEARYAEVAERVRARLRGEPPPAPRGAAPRETAPPAAAPRAPDSREAARAAEADGEGAPD
jgi:putative ATPase